MQKPLLLFIVCLIGLSHFSCQEKEVINVTQVVNDTISGNVAPPYAGINTLQLQNYVNKLHIDLVGAEPSEVELDAAVAALRADNLSLEARTQVILTLQNNPNYYSRLWDAYVSGFIGGISTFQIDQSIGDLQGIRVLAVQQGDDALVARIDVEIEKLELLKDAPDDFASGAINIVGWMSRVALNIIYDEINMGAENFVLACFENFHKRFPTESEQERAIVMVEGFPAQLLLKDGNSKSDFVEIILTTEGYYQGVILDLYSQLLAREPNSIEMANGLLDFQADLDFKKAQRALLVTDEYAGW